MSIPAPGTPWPPTPFDRHLANIDPLHAWWEGNLSRLVEPVTTRSATGTDPRKFADKLFGRPVRAKHAGPRTARMVHVPIAADLCQTSATLMAGEPPAFVVPDTGGNDKARDRADLILNAPDFHADLLVGEESGAALGDYYARISWDRDLADAAWIEFVDGDRAFPTYLKGTLRSVLFWEELEGGGRDDVYRHLELHVSGYIEHALFLGSRSNLGKQLPLEAHDATKAIPADAYGRVPTGTAKLTACHVPNRGPNVAYRREPALRRLGRPDLTEPLMGLMWQVNETYSSLARDVRLAKARLILSDTLVRNGPAGTGAAFDVDQEAFATVRGNPTEPPVIEAHQFSIRVEDHLRTADGYIRAILRNAGYSPLAFGLKDETTGSTTATEIDAKDRGSAATKGHKSLRRQAAFSRLATALIEVDAAVYSTGATISEPVEVEYSPANSPTQMQLAQTVQALEAARAASTKTKVDMLHPDWDETKRQEEADRILAEQSGPALPDPFGIGEDVHPDDIETDDDEDETGPPEGLKPFAA